MENEIALERYERENDSWETFCNDNAAEIEALADKISREADKPLEDAMREAAARIYYGENV